MGKFAHSYEELCFQFISSFKCEYIDHRVDKLSFKFEGMRYNLEVAQIRDALGVTKGFTELQRQYGEILRHQEEMMHIQLDFARHYPFKPGPPPPQ